MLAEVLIGYLVITGGVFLYQREMLYHPTDKELPTVMERVELDQQTLGFVREVESPAGVWLVCHGNGGQAAKRDYLLDDVADDTMVYVLEYPGFGDRPGKPNMKAMNAAAAAAYQFIREQHPGLPVGVIGESIGSGPASWLSQQDPAPDKIVLLVPYDRLARVVAGHMPFFPARWLLRDRWDNIAALAGYDGPVEVYGAEDDAVIPIKHARALAEAVPGATFTVMAGDHDEWILVEPFQLPVQ